MRLPVLGGDPGKIDEPPATEMLRYAIDHGVNYVDTAYPYHRGASEVFLGRALQDGYRERIRLATKCPVWKLEKPSDFDKYLREQLSRLQTEQIDFYLLHALNERHWSRILEHRILERAERALADDRIGYLGFSFHDSLETFKKIIDGYDKWTFCQIQYNFMDVEYQAGREGLHYAADRGLAVVVMEPIRGGRLANNIPPPVQAIWDRAPVERTPAERALQWVWNQSEVSLLLSGMSTMAHVIENLASANRSGPGILQEPELTLYEAVRAEYERLCPIPCTNCKYCLPCPSGVNIPRVLEIYNDLMMYGDENRAQMVYDSFLKEEERANLCIVCGECLEKCPQMIEIPDLLAEIHGVLCPEEPA
jgi:predicted aldo/keto reductase-like oxidoreductase